MAATDGTKEKKHGVERWTIFAWWISIVALIVCAAIWGYNEHPMTWVLVVALVADIVSMIALAVGGKNMNEALKKFFIYFIFGVFFVLGFNGLSPALGYVYLLISSLKDWVDLSLALQPEIRKPAQGASLLFEMVAALVVGVAGRLVLYQWTEFTTDKKKAVLIAFSLYALARGQIWTFLIAVLLGMGVIRVLKNLVKDEAKEVVQKAKDKDRWNLAIWLGAVSTVAIGLFLAQGPTWVIGLLVTYAQHPFTTISFLAQGMFVGGWFQIKIEK